jgi:hypothetical protein
MHMVNFGMDDLPYLSWIIKSNQPPGTGELKYISKYLVQYVAATPKTKPAASYGGRQLPLK